MMVFTHFLFNLALLPLILNFFAINNPFLFGLTYIISGLIPDIDLPRSYLGKKHKIISNIINVFFGHRGFIHTIFPPLLFSSILLYLGYLEISVALFLGYISHLVLDMLTVRGIKLFHPFLDINIKGFFRTSGFFERFLQIILIIILISHF